jgi:hypothetical protein
MNEWIALEINCKNCWAGKWWVVTLSFLVNQGLTMWRHHIYPQQRPKHFSDVGFHVGGDFEKMNLKSIMMFIWNTTGGADLLNHWKAVWSFILLSDRGGRGLYRGVAQLLFLCGNRSFFQSVCKMILFLIWLQHASSDIDTHISAFSVVVKIYVWMLACVCGGRWYSENLK